MTIKVRILPPPPNKTMSHHKFIKLPLKNPGSWPEAGICIIDDKSNGKLIQKDNILTSELSKFISY